MAPVHQTSSTIKHRIVVSVAVHVPCITSNAGRRVTAIATNSASTASANSFDMIAVRLREKNRNPAAIKAVAAAMAGKQFTAIDTNCAKTMSANSCASAAVRLGAKNNSATATKTAVSATMELIP